jgi:hypothetical protein
MANRNIIGSLYVDPSVSETIDEIANAAEAKGNIPFDNAHSGRASHPDQDVIFNALSVCKQAYKRIHGHEPSGGFGEMILTQIFTAE